MPRSRIFVLLLALPLACFAHQITGPHTALQGFLHPLTGMDHLLAMLAVGWLAAQSGGGKGRTLIPLSFLVGMVMGFGVGVAGFRTGSLEYAVAFSVIALGGIVAFAVRSRHLWAFTLIAGVCHGLVHGTEMPSSSNTAVFLGSLLASSGMILFLGTQAHNLSSKNDAFPAIRFAASGLLVVAGIRFLLGIA